MKPLDLQKVAVPTRAGDPGPSMAGLKALEAQAIIDGRTQDAGEYARMTQRLMHREMDEHEVSLWQKAIFSAALSVVLVLGIVFFVQ